MSFQENELKKFLFLSTSQQLFSDENKIKQFKPKKEKRV